MALKHNLTDEHKHLLHEALALAAEADNIYTFLQRHGFDTSNAQRTRQELQRVADQMLRELFPAFG